jgi:uncharacterized phage protein (TIGR01671 family)
MCDLQIYGFLTHYGQFTGLKDKNGKEIYEGDVINLHDLCEMINVNAIIEWSDEGCFFRPREIRTNRKGGRYWFYWDFITDIEIIGNIYENPELLKQEK